MKLSFAIIYLAHLVAYALATDYANWMANLYPDLKELPLTRLSIPGSHNSFTYYLNPNDGFADNKFSWIANANQVYQPLSGFFSALGISSSITRRSPNQIASEWSKCQNLTTLEQLNRGIRHFDARIAYKNKFVIMHGLYGLNVSAALSPIADFLKAHPYELAFIVIRETSFSDVTVHRSFADELRRIFGNLILSYQTPTSTRQLSQLSLAQVQSTSIGRVLIFYDERPLPGAARTFWPLTSLQQLWPNSNNRENAINYLDRQISSNAGNGRESQFLEFQAIVTPTDNDISTGIDSSLKDKMADTMTARATRWLNDKYGTAVEQGAINFCMADFVTQAFVDSVLNLNY